MSFHVDEALDEVHFLIKVEDGVDHTFIAPRSCIKVLRIGTCCAYGG